MARKRTAQRYFALRVMKLFKVLLLRGLGIAVATHQNNSILREWRNNSLNASKKIPLTNQEIPVVPKSFDEFCSAMIGPDQRHRTSRNYHMLHC